MLPTTQSSTWFPGLASPSRLFDNWFEDYELYEDDDEFVLTVDMPGFELEDIKVTWDEGRLFVSAEHADADRGTKKTYSRSFRLPKAVESDDIEAQYRNGILEIRLPIVGPAITGTEIEVIG